ncbi:unnamed protein product [Discula destructiva]
MKFSVLSLGLLAVLTPLAAAWSKEDREIFAVRDELSQTEGADVTFYDFLGIVPSASHDDIQKAYRKKSKSLHPDKVKQQLMAEANKLKKEAAKNKKSAVPVAKPPTSAEIKAAVKAAGDRQARLSIVANVLKGPGRARYDHFMANGFPAWKGTGYYYDRYRPGLGTVMIGVFLALGGGVHYLALYMSWKQHREFVERYIKYARTAAWGDNLGINIDTAPVEVAAPPPEQEQAQAIPTNRRMRRMQEKETKRDSSQEGVRGRLGRKVAARTAAAAQSGSATPVPTDGPQGARKKVRAENGKILVVDSLGDVYLEQEDEEGNLELFLLDLNEIAKPTISDTALVKLPKWIFNMIAGRVLTKKTKDDSESDFEEDEITAAESDTSSGPGKHTPDSEEFELLDKSMDDIAAAISAKTTGSQSQSGKNNKRKGKGKKR